MREDTPAGPLTATGWLAASPYVGISLIAPAPNAARHHRARGARLESRHNTRNPEFARAVFGVVDSAPASGPDPRDVRSASLAASVVPALADSVDAAAWQQLVEGSPIIHAAAGELIYPCGTTPVVLAIVHGVARLHIRAPGGRELTMRCARAGDAVGISAAPSETTESWVKAATDTTIALLPVRRLRALGAENTQLAGLIVTLLAAPAENPHLGSAAPERHSMTARIAGHLFEMTIPAMHGAMPEGVSEQCLAVAAGIARLVASRSLGRLRAAGVVDMRRGTVVITDRKRLSRIARGKEQTA